MLIENKGITEITCYQSKEMTNYSATFSNKSHNFWKLVQAISSKTLIKALLRIKRY